MPLKKQEKSVTDSDDPERDGSRSIGSGTEIRKRLTARSVQFYIGERGRGMADMTLREVCGEMGVSRRAVQGYEKAALVAATGRNDRGHLLYDTAAQERIRRIKLYQDMGFSLKQIKLIIDDSGPMRRKALIRQKEKLRREARQKTDMIRIIEEMLRQS